MYLPSSKVKDHVNQWIRIRAIVVTAKRKDFLILAQGPAK
jgi:hypothetical protein